MTSIRSFTIQRLLIGFIVCVLTQICAFAADTEQSPAPEWRTPEAENTVYLDTPDGRIIIELNPTFAPKTVAQFKRLVREKFYDGLRFYRVIDGFVAQGGDGSDVDVDVEGELTQPALPAEFERRYNDGLPFVSAQKNDLFAAETGFVNGFPAARDTDGQNIWLTHCPGTMAMARGNEPDSGSTDFYIVIGQAPRYLDRNLTIFGRVISGMDIVQRIKRGPTDANGIIENKFKQTPLLKAILAADVPEAQREYIQVMDTNHNEFSELLNNRRHRTHEFFHFTPPAVLDVCQVPIPTQTP